MSTAEVVNFPVSEVKKVADLEDGYTRIANEIYEAIIGSSLTQNQSKVAHAIVRLTYGYNKKNDRIADSQIAKITNLPRQKVNKAKNELIAMNIISREANKIGINKAVFEWNFNKCHQNNDNVTKTVTKIVTKTVTRVSPKQSHTKDIISKDNKDTNNRNLKSPKNKLDFELIKNAYNDAVESEEFTPVKTINEKRKASIKKLIKQLEDPTEKGLINYFYDFAEKAPDWTRGKTSINFTAHFDYILRPEIYIKFIEGSL